MNILNKIDAYKSFKFFFFVVFSFLLGRVSYQNNFLIFLVPFLVYSILEGKKYYLYSMFGSILSLLNKGGYDWLILLSVLVFIYLGFYYLKKQKLKILTTLRLITFLSTFLGGLTLFYIYNQQNFLTAVIGSIIAFWLITYMYESHLSRLSNKKYLSPQSSIVIFSLIGVSLIGLGIDLLGVSVGIILVKTISLILVKSGFGIGLSFSFNIGLILAILYPERSNEILLFIGTTSTLFYLRNISKISYIVSFLALSLLIIYQFKMPYIYLYEALFAGFTYFLIPSFVSKKISSICVGNEDILIEKEKENEKFYHVVSNKMSRFAHLFSSISKRIEENKRLNKKYKYEISKEIALCADLIEKFSYDIKSSKDFEYDLNRKLIEEQLIKNSVYLLYLNIQRDQLKKIKIEFAAECSKDQIESIILPLFNKELGLNFNIAEIIYNDFALYYKVTLISKKKESIIYGVSQIAKDYEACGDSYKFYEDEKKSIVSLSDGMGYGKGAQNESRLALDLIHNFIDLGIDVQNSVNYANSILKNGETKECFATLDVLFYNHSNGMASIVKSGASSSYIIRNEEIVKIEGSSLPIGIIEDANCQKTQFDFNKGDYLVMVSDGIGDNVEYILPSIKKGHPQNMAQEIIKRVKEIGNDDKSVLVAKLV